MIMNVSVVTVLPPRWPYGGVRRVHAVKRLATDTEATITASPEDNPAEREHRGEVTATSAPASMNLTSGSC